MDDKKIIALDSGSEALSFPVKWIKSNQGEVERILSKLSVSEQAQCAMQLRGEEQMNLLLLSPNGREVVQSMPPEQVYQLIKEVGGEEALPVLACATQEQIQFIFDVDWWMGDKFRPDKAVEWLKLLDDCEESKALEWILTEEFDQKVMVLQSLIKVFKDDEMTDSYEGVENLKHLTLDSVYDIFIKIPDAELPLEKIFKLLVATDKKIFDALMDAVIWYPVTQTVETAYRWRLTRVAELGIPEFEEACEVYSRLDPESLTLPVPSEDDFQDEESPYSLAPHFPLLDADPSTFLGQCLARMKDQQRINAICWELVYLANKVMVADRSDPSELETRNEIMRKVLGYINIGLELGAENDPSKGLKLLRSTWMQSLFQVGYGTIMQLRSQAWSLTHEKGKLLELLLNPGQREHLSALVYRFPKVGVIRESGGEERPSFYWRDFKSLHDVQTLESIIPKMKFYVRFARQSLDLTEEKLLRVQEQIDFPEDKDDVDMVHILTTIMARFLMFKEISFEPIKPVAAKTFLEIIFLPGIYAEESRVCKDDLIGAFHDKLLKTEMAWTEEDKALLNQLLLEVKTNLESQFGRLNLKEKIDWGYTRGLCLADEKR